MPELKAERFSANDLARVQGLDCGDEEWSSIVSDWIKGKGTSRPKALDLLDNATAQAEIWIFSSNEQLVGYGATAAKRWRWPDGEYANITLIAAFGLDVMYHGEPADVPKSQRFAYKMMSHLLAESLKYKRQFVGLCVHKDNKRAIRFYENIGFRLLPDNDRIEYLRMILDLGATG